MRKIVFLTAAVIIILLFTGCSIGNNPGVEKSDSAPEINISRAYNPKYDLEYKMGIGGKMYIDLAASNNELYRLHTNGNVMMNNIRPSMTSIGTLYRNYDAIDYVTDGNDQWGLIGASNETQRIYIDGKNRTDLYGIYPDNVDYVYDIAARQLDSNRLYIYIVVPQQYYGKYLRKGIYDKRVTNSNTRITWDSTSYPYGTYSRGVCMNGTKLMFWLIYTQIKLMRKTPPNGTVEEEDLGSYDSHAYNGGEILETIGFDYCPADNYYYCLDNMGTSSQAIVRLAASGIKW